jgi:hypothetical protein
MAKQTSSSKQRSGTVQSKEGAGNRQSGQNASNRQGASAQVQGRRLSSRTAQRAAKQQQRQQQLKDDRRAGLITLLCILATVIIGGGAIAGVIIHNQTTTAVSPPVNSAYPAVDGISCDAGEQLAYHIHAHVSIYINGKLSNVPQYVGIASDGTCYYWLHTHDTSGVIHIESPTQKDYMLGNFFDEWSQRFSSLGYPSELDLTSGWQVWVDGKPYSGDFHNIPLTAHKLITLAYNSPGVKPDTTYAWNGL